ncbi:MAG: hypothetical protein AB7F74_11585 [Parvibaculaceae bacterium]
MAEITFANDLITRVRKEMEVITADGRCAGHVSGCSASQIFMSRSRQTIPKEWIRRVDREVYISKRWYELAH